MKVRGWGCPYPFLARACLERISAGERGRGIRRKVLAGPARGDRPARRRHAGADEGELSSSFSAFYLMSCSLVWPGSMRPKRACALLPWRECSRGGSARQRGQCALRDNGNVIFKRLRAQRLTCQAETSRKMDMSMRHATLRWRYAGLPSARVL